MKVCHCNVKENAELIAKIFDCDSDKKEFKFNGLTMRELMAYVDAYDALRDDMESGKLIRKDLSKF